MQRLSVFSNNRIILTLYVCRGIYQAFGRVPLLALDHKDLVYMLLSNTFLDTIYMCCIDRARYFAGLLCGSYSIQAVLEP